jgi:hypothetical protein
VIDLNYSRRDTTAAKFFHFAQLPLGAGTRSFTHKNLSLRVAARRSDRDLVANIVRRRHYLERWPVPPRTLILSYLANLGGEGAAAMSMVAMLPTNYGALLPALGLHPCEVLQLVRCWRADDLDPKIAPDLMPEVLRRVVRRLAADWTETKCENLQALPRLLVTYADPAVGHDGKLYLGAGAVALGGDDKLCFAWALDGELKQPLRGYAAARKERA